MPREMAFTDAMTPTTTFEFESIRSHGKHVFPGFKGVTHMLTPYKTREPYAALHPGDCKIAFPTNEFPDIFWKPQVINTYSSDGPTYAEVARTFSMDPDEKDVEWFTMLAALPAFFSQHFTAIVPTLWQEHSQGRIAIVDPQRKPLVTVHEPWRDSDGERGVSKQYKVHDMEHPMWRRALWTAFCLRP